MRPQIDHIERMLRALVTDGAAGIAGPRSEAHVKETESALGVDFPPSYRQFIQRCGAAVVGDSNFLGIWSTPLGEDSSGTYWHTLRCRNEYGLPHHYIVVLCDEGDEILWCLDTRRVDCNKEYSVIQFNIEDNTVADVSKDFGTMLYEYLVVFLED